jgi:diaminohydroxyphosphoribosylaminopyrimidine deaminase/5-amino-6-(5-phosphoribosylamino)uracil reductase
MDMLAGDALWMERALELARGAVGLTSPNPTVGCVLVGVGGEVLGEGAHRYAERDHAEIVALKRAAARGREVRGATAYVTLEPCAHHGRTGPCSEALVAAGVGRCVVATVDPNALVSGKGLELLRAAGVEVVVMEGALAMEARRLNDAFAWFIQKGRPFVTLKAAVSVDGMLAPAAGKRSAVAPHWITGRAARDDAQGLRHAADAVMVGMGTVAADDPLLTDRTGMERRRALLRVVLDSGLRLSVESRLVKSVAGDLLVVCAEDAGVDRAERLMGLGVEVLRVKRVAGGLDVKAVLEALGRRGVVSVLVEAGSALNGAMLREGLVEKVVLYFAESEMGLDGVPFAAGVESPYEVVRRLTGVGRASFVSDGAGEDVRVSGYLRDPWVG